jgi:hypothetical protein
VRDVRHVGCVVLRRRQLRQNGLGETITRHTPTPVPGSWSAISTSGDHTCATTNRTSPVQIGVATNWTSVNAGTFHTCGIRSPGSLWCWGRNDGGQLGDRTTTTRTTPVRIGTANDWTQVSVGEFATCGLRSGRLWCWGQNSAGEVGDGTTLSRLVPTAVLDPEMVGRVFAGSTSTFTIRGRRHDVPRCVPAMPATWWLAWLAPGR